jgi:transposase-like protein
MLPISYCDLELMLLDRGVEVNHTTIFRWIQTYPAPTIRKGQVRNIACSDIRAQAKFIAKLVQVVA